MVDLRRSCRTAIARITGDAASRNRRNESRADVHFTDPGVAEIPDVKIPRPVHAQPGGQAQFSRYSRLIVPVIAGPQGATRHGVDDPGTEGDGADAAVGGIGDIKDTLVVVDGQGGRAKEGRGGRRAAVPAEAASAGSREIGDGGAGGVDLPDMAAAEFGNIHVPVGIEDDARGFIDFG